MTLNHQGKVLNRNSDWEDEESDNNLYPTIDLERELTIRDVFNFELFTCFVNSVSPRFLVVKLAFVLALLPRCS